MTTIQVGGLRIDMAMNAGKFITGARQVEERYQGLADRIGRLNERMNAASVHITSGMFAAQRFLSVSTSLTSVAAEFEKGMSNVSTLVDTNTESMEKMTKAVQGIAGKTPVALSELTVGLYDIRSAGVAAEDALAVLEKSARLGVAGLGTTKEAVDLVTSSLNAFGLKGVEATNVYDNIFRTVKAGKTTITGLSEGFGAVAGVVANANIKLDDYLSSVAALTITGLPASIAHTQLRAAIIALSRDTEETKALFDALGVKTFKELVVQSGNVGTAFRRIQTAFHGNDALFIKTMGSAEAYNAVIGLGGKQNQIYTETLRGMRDGTNAVDEAFNKQNATMSAASQRLQNNIQIMTDAFGMALKPAVDSLANTIEGLTRAFQSLDPETQAMVAQIGAISLILVPLITSFGFFANALASLGPVVAAITGIIAALGRTILGLIVATGPIGMFIIAASTVIIAWTYFKDQIIAIWNRVVEIITYSIDYIVTKISELVGWMKQLLGVNDDVSKSWGSMISDIVPRTAENVTTVTKSVQGMGTAWKTVIEEIPPQFNDKYVQPISHGMSALEKLIQKQHNKALSDAKTIITEIQTPMEALEAKQWKIQAAFDAGGLSIEQYSRAMAQATAINTKNIDALASTMASNMETIFGKSKATSIAVALINTYQGITQALASYPPPISFAMAAIQAAAGFAQVMNIRKQSKSGDSGASASSATAAASAGAASMPQKLIVEGIDSGSFFSGSNVRDLAQKLLAYQRDGGQVVLK